jgi:hypothetical protein
MMATLHTQAFDGGILVLDFDFMHGIYLLDAIKDGFCIFFFNNDLFFSETQLRQELRFAFSHTA